MFSWFISNQLQIFTMNTVITLQEMEKSIEIPRSTYLCFVDVKNAFYDARLSDHNGDFERE